jgi:hypothetical protein
MKFDRFIRAERRPITGRRLAAARRALQRKSDEVALFPELQPTQTPEERCRQFDDNTIAFVQSLRDHRASNWRRARHQLRTMLPFLRGIVEARFFRNRFMPKDPVYLLEIIRAVTKEEPQL